MKLTNTRILTFIFSGCIAFQSFSQKIEAESGTLAGGATKVTDASRSGGAYVNTQEGSITWTTNVATTGFFNIYINVAAPFGDKQNNFELDGNSASFSTPNNANYIKLKVISSQKINAGSHTLKITKSWGWISVDYIELEAIDPSTRFNISKTLVTTNPTKEAACL